MRAIITVTFFFLSLTLLGQVNDVDAFFNGSYDKALIRKYNIKQLIVETHINNDKTSLSLFDFDQKGFLAKRTVFDSNGKKVNEYTFTYNEQGDQTERKNIAYDLNKTYTVSFTKKYDGSQLVQETSSELPFVTKHVYDNKGKKIQSITFLSSDTTTSARRIFIYTYDTKGRLESMQETYFESSSAAPVNIKATEFIYNAAGNVTAIIQEGKANCELSHDKNGLLKSKTITMPDDLGGMKIVDEYSYFFWR